MCPNAEYRNAGIAVSIYQPVHTLIGLRKIWQNATGKLEFMKPLKNVTRIKNENF
jgi:hypothetical protein